MIVFPGGGETGSGNAGGGPHFEGVGSFVPASTHASRDFVLRICSEEAAARAMACDSIQRAVQTVDTRLFRHVGDDTHVTLEDKARWDGKAPLENGMIPAALLPSYVDDVIEAASFDRLPPRGETGKIYVTLDENRQYRWSGSAYVEVSKSVSLGETASSAYPGDKGKKNAEDIGSLKTGKQDLIVGEQLDALNSGATKAKIDSIENKQEKLTDKEKAVLGKGPYLPTIGGGTVLGRYSEQGEPLGAEIKLNNLDGGGSVVEIKSGTQGGPASIIVGDGASGPASIRKGDREVATEEQVATKADEFTAWVVHSTNLDIEAAIGGNVVAPEKVDYMGTFLWSVSIPSIEGYSQQWTLSTTPWEEDLIKIEFPNYYMKNDSSYGFTLTRKRVLRTGDDADGLTDEAKNSLFSSDEFVSAVEAVFDNGETEAF